MGSTHAQQLAMALNANSVIEPLGETVLPDLEAAYAVQRAFVDALATPLGGWKIGATNAKSQGLMGLDGPFYGPMPKQFCVTDGADFQMPKGVIGAEIEIAFKLKSDLPKRDQAYELADMLDAVDGVHLAIEVIGLRQKWQGLPEGRHAIADLGANCIFVHSRSPIPDLAQRLAKEPTAITARCLVDDVEKGQGDASLVLGNPLLSLLWLANEGPGLKTGQMISTGTITGLAPITSPCRVIGDFGTLGQVRLNLVA